MPRLISLGLLAESQPFRLRVKAAVLEHAFEVLGEGPNAPGWPARGVFARRALTNPDEVTDLVLGAVATSSAILTDFEVGDRQSDIPDDAIRARVAATWNHIGYRASGE